MSDQFSTTPMSSFEEIPSGEPPEKKSNTTLIIIIVVVVLLCCCCAAVVGGFGWWLWNNGDALFGISRNLLGSPVI